MEQNVLQNPCRIVVRVCSKISFTIIYFYRNNDHRAPTAPSEDVLAYSIREHIYTPVSSTSAVTTNACSRASGMLQPQNTSKWRACAVQTTSTRIPNEYRRYMFFETTLRNNHALYYYLLLSSCHKCRRNRELYPEFNLALRTCPKLLVSPRLFSQSESFFQ